MKTLIIFMVSILSLVFSAEVMADSIRLSDASNHTENIQTIESANDLTLITNNPIILFFFIFPVIVCFLMARLYKLTRGFKSVAIGTFFAVIGITAMILVKIGIGNTISYIVLLLISTGAGLIFTKSNEEWIAGLKTKIENKEGLY